MNMRAILEGALMGLAIALLLAFVIAIVDYQWGLSAGIQTGGVWVAAAITFIGAGWGAGRIVEAASWIHGALAAMTLNLVSILVGETAHLGNVTHLWMGLAMAVLAGFIGGVLGAASQ